MAKGTFDLSKFRNPFSRQNRLRGITIILLIVLLAFEIFNYNTTEFSLTDMLGDLTFAGIRWATILAIAFCGIDFAGVARIFTPEQGKQENKEVWYLLGAWFVAAAFNAVLTWWGTKVAIVTHQMEGGRSLAVSSDFVVTWMPIFIAALVLLIRFLLITSFSINADKDLNSSYTRSSYTPTTSVANPQASSFNPRPAAKASPASIYSKLPGAQSGPIEAAHYRPASSPSDRNSSHEL